MPPGAEIKVQIFRNGQTMTFDVSLAELPDRTARLTPGGPAEALPDASTDAADLELLRKLGIEQAVALTRENAAQYDVTFKQVGVLIQRVRPTSVAASKGLTPGMVITDVMGQAVKSPKALVDQLQKHDLSKGVRISVLAGDQHVFMLLELDAE